MSENSIRQKWRPRLSVVIVAILSLIGTLPIASLAFFRIYETQLVRAAEGELISQSAVLAAAYAEAVERAPERPDLLGDPVTAAEGDAIEPGLDLAADAVLPERPEPRPTDRPVRPTAMAIGRELSPLIARTKRVTLAGFRVLDADGTIIAGGLDVGRSLSDLPEVASARAGRFRAVMRARTPSDQAPPLYSISRGTRIRVFTALPVVVDGRIAGVIYGSRTPNNMMRQIYAESGKVILALGILIGAIGLIAFVFARVFVRPIHGLVVRAAALGRGETAPGSAATHYGTHEIALLAASVDEMASRLRERSDYIATFAAHVSHELKSPLTAIQGGAELMRDALDEADAPMLADTQRRFLDAIIAQANRLSIMLGRLREMARADNPRTDGTTDIGAVATALRSAHPGLAVTVAGDEAAILDLSPENAAIVFGHLADNAMRHGAHTLRISVRPAGDGLDIAVANDGRAIPVEIHEQIFDDFFTTRREIGGTGMGLSIVRAMLAAHRGRITLDAAETAGFRIQLQPNSCRRTR